MSTLQDVRDKVRLQVDLDEEDMPNGILDGYIREGFDRTFAQEARWPFFQHQWDVTKNDGATTIDMPTSPSVAVIMRLRSSDNYNLVMVGQQAAEDEFQGTQGTTTSPSCFSVWGDTISLWPTPSDEEMTFTLRGYRDPTWTGAADTELDGDERLHLPIFHYAVSLCYAQLEDPELEMTYMQRWAAGVDQIRRDIMRPNVHEPTVLNGGLGRARRRHQVEWGDLV